MDFRISGVPLDENTPPVSFYCQQWNISNWKNVQLIGYEPLLTEVVHHMDVFLCDDKLGSRFVSPGQCNTFQGFMHAISGPCYQMVFAYDKGASGFTLPDHVGLRLGEVTPYTTILMQIHYLMPETDQSVALYDVAAGQLAAPCSGATHQQCVLARHGVQADTPVRAALDLDPGTCAAFA